MIAIRLVSAGDASLESVCSDLAVTVFDEDGEREVEMVPLSDGSGVVAVTNLRTLTSEARNRFQSPSEYGMRWISAGLYARISTPRAVLFRGIRIVKL
jgi:hypothetical protein